MRINNGPRNPDAVQRTVYVRPRFALVWAAASDYAEVHDVPLSTIASEGVKLWLEAHGVDAPLTRAR